MGAFEEKMQPQMSEWREHYQHYLDGQKSEFERIRTFLLATTCKPSSVLGICAHQVCAVYRVVVDQLDRDKSARENATNPPLKETE